MLELWQARRKCMSLAFWTPPNASPCHMHIKLPGPIYATRHGLLVYVHHKAYPEGDSLVSWVVAFVYHSSEVYASISLPSLLLRSIGSSRISTPGPIGLALLCDGKIWSSNQLCDFVHAIFNACDAFVVIAITCLHTLVLLHPSLNAASCANNSPNPSIKPLTNGKSKLIAAPLTMLQNVGGWYKIMGDEESDGGSSDESFELE